MAEWYYSEKDQVIADTRATAETAKRIEKNQKAMLDAFNNIAKQLGDLATEIKGLRDDLNPQLDKSKLPRPAQSSGQMP